MLYDDLLKGLVNNNLVEVDNPIIKSELKEIAVIKEYPKDIKSAGVELFSIDNFTKNLKTNSALTNKKFIDTSERLNAYDIVHSCIRTPIFRLSDVSISDYSDNWLPVRLRATFGSACHDFLQTNSTSFTEIEVYLRVPSLNISVKIDALTETNTLVEIKTCSYADYSKILKSGHARTEDFYQALLYKYLLENYIDEAKSQNIDLVKYNIPKFDKYNIDTIQMIYVCHELFSSDYSSLDQAVNESKQLKKMLKSKYNFMWFINPINYDVSLSKYDLHIRLLKEKIDEANYYLSNNIVPSMTNKFIDKSKCFFCLYKKHCSTIS